MGIISSLLGKKAVDFKTLIEQDAIIVDVRGPQEFASGHVQGSVNIPLEVIGSNAELLKKEGRPIITCCKSGVRSEIAYSILKSKGLDVYNGGAWNKLKQQIINI